MSKLDYDEKRRLRQKFGVLFQGSALFDSINTFENIAFPLRYFTNDTEKEIEKKVMRSLAYVNLESAAAKETSELSGGMRKREGLARESVVETEYSMAGE